MGAGILGREPGIRPGIPRARHSGRRLRPAVGRGIPPRVSGRVGRDRSGYDRTYGSRYDRDYDVRPEEYHPRFSPVGGMDAGMGGEYLKRGEPRPLRESRPTSEWTRWF